MTTLPTQPGKRLQRSRSKRGEGGGTTSIGKVDLVILLTLMLILMMEMMLILVTTMISKWFSPGTLTGRRLSRCRWCRRGGGFLGLRRATGYDDVDDGGNDGGDDGDYDEVILVVMIMIK